MKHSDKTEPSKPRGRFWINLSLACFRNWLPLLILWVLIVASSVYVYTQIIAKEGFPSFNPSFVFVEADYFNDNPDQIDQIITKPLHQAVAEVEGIDNVNTTTTPQGIFSVISFQSNTEETDNLRQVEKALADNQTLFPEDITFKVNVPQIAQYLGKYDLMLTVYDSSQQSSLTDIQTTAESIADQINRQSSQINAEAVAILVEHQQTQEQQPISYNYFGTRIDDQQEAVFYKAIHIGISRHSQEIDYLELSSLVEEKLTQLDLTIYPGDYQVEIAADFAFAIERNITSLEGNLLTGLIIISILSFLLISLRASIVIALFMVSVLAVTILVLYAIGFSLNVITLFALILSLGLLVDDAVIMVEALDVYKQKRLKDKEVIKQALGRILLASLAGTLTTVLVFMPLAFIPGILGEIVRYIPLTLAVVLLTSFFFSITLIPMLARFTILREGNKSVYRRYNLLLRLEKNLAHFFGSLTLLLKVKPKRGRIVMVSLIFVALGLIVWSFGLSSRLGTDIFPVSKDQPFLRYSVDFPSDYDLKQAETAAVEIHQIIAKELGDDLVSANYVGDFLPNSRSLSVDLTLTPLSERDVFSSVLAEELQDILDQTIDPEIEIFINQQGNGPSSSNYPFSIRLKADDRQNSIELAQAIKEYLLDPDSPSQSGGDGNPVIEKVKISANDKLRNRLNDYPIITLSARYNQNNPSSNVLQQTRENIENQFNAEYLRDKGYDETILDTPDTQENFEESFYSLAIIFPIALILIYVLLAWQFRSLFQPWILFLALPFALIGVLNWLYFTETPFSFFVGIGFITLIGIVVNNTILLTTYANRSREKLDSVEAISLAVKERFRPLVLTTITTILALLPLAINDFFWQNLALTIIWGMVSSVILVLLVFPYGYLFFERFSKSGRRAAKAKKLKSKTKKA